MTTINSIVRFLIICGGLVGALIGLSIDNAIVAFTFILCVALTLPFAILQKGKNVFVTLLIVSIWRLAFVLFSGATLELPLYELFPCWLLFSIVLLGIIRGRCLRVLLWMFVVLSLSRCAYWASSKFTQSEQAKIAYLERGKWGISHVEQQALNIQSQYSYSLLKRSLAATPIDNLDSIDSFDTLWMTTPTIPFTNAERDKLLEWIKRGGRLILISDHTDLYGHATVLNQLLHSIGIKLGKDCVIRDSGQVPYLSLVGAFLGLTSNTIRGNCWPILLQVGFCERADYFGKGFFSDNAVTDEDIAGVYCAGAIRRFGRGEIVLFGDSTLFADFALSRPSSQIVLRMVRDGIAVFNFPFIFMMLLAMWFFLKQEKRTGYILVGCLLLLIVAYCAYFLCSMIKRSDFPLFFDRDINTVCVSGRFDLVDRDGEKLSTLFSTLFAMPVAFPEWCIFSGEDGVIYDNVSLDISTDVARPLAHRSLSDAFTDMPTLDANDFEKQLISLAGCDGMWFDSGVGMLKNTAYSNYWNGVFHEKTKNIRVGDSQIISNVLYYVNGNAKTNLFVRKTEIHGERDWCIIGDWILGKRIGKNVLIREKWQHPNRRYGDIVIELDDAIIRDL